MHRSGLLPNSYKPFYNSPSTQRYRARKTNGSSPPIHQKHERKVQSVRADATANHLRRESPPFKGGHTSRDISYRGGFDRSHKALKSTNNWRKSPIFDDEGYGRSTERDNGNYRGDKFAKNTGDISRDANDRKDILQKRNRNPFIPRNNITVPPISLSRHTRRQNISNQAERDSIPLRHVGEYVRIRPGVFIESDLPDDDSNETSPLKQDAVLKKLPLRKEKKGPRSNPQKTVSQNIPISLKFTLWLPFIPILIPLLNSIFPFKVPPSNVPVEPMVSAEKFKEALQDAMNSRAELNLYTSGDQSRKQIPIGEIEEQVGGSGEAKRTTTPDGSTAEAGDISQTEDGAKELEKGAILTDEEVICSSQPTLPPKRSRNLLSLPSKVQRKQKDAESDP